MCKLFGVVFAPSGPKGSTEGDPNYTYTPSSGQLRCQYCQASCAPESNIALRPVLHHFLSLSLPFAACRNPECENYGLNLFENFTDGKSGPYRKHRDHSVRCRACGRAFAFGATYGKGNPQAKIPGMRGRYLPYIILAQRLGARLRRVAFEGQIHPETYYTFAHQIGRRLGDLHAYRTARLLDPQVAEGVYGVARVYTDVAFFALRRDSAENKHKLLSVIVSVLALDNRRQANKDTYFILAAHPAFLPKKYCRGAYEEPYIDPVTGGPSAEFAEKWRCLEHPVHIPFTGTTKRMLRNLPDLSRIDEGYYINPLYAHAAHFLVVRKILSRMKKICFFMDGDYKMASVAMAALSDGILKREIDIVLIQRKYRKSRKDRSADAPGAMGRARSKTRARALREAWDKTEATVETMLSYAGWGMPTEEQFRPKPSSLDTVSAPKKKKKRKKPPPLTDPAQAAAHAFRYAYRYGGFTSGSDWAWLDYPAPVGDGEIAVRSLWLTRMPGKSAHDGKRALFSASMLPIDGAINAMRARTRALTRPSTGGIGRSYVDNFYSPPSLLSELRSYLFFRNFTILSPEQTFIPARVLGLMGKKETLPATHLLVESFRLGLPEAEKMTQWSRR